LLNISGLNFNYDYKDQTAVINFKLPEPIMFPIMGIKSSFIFTPIYPIRSIYNKEFTIGQNVNFVLETTDANNISFHNLLNMVYIFKKFLNIAIKSTVLIEEIIFYSSALITECEGNVTLYDKIELFMKNSEKGAEKQLSHWNMLFAYKDIKENFKIIISNWYNNQDKLVTILGKFLQEFNRTDYFDENNFINMAQALESFHRIYVQGKIGSDGVNKPKSHPLLKDRIAELQNIYSNNFLDKIIKEKEQFAVNWIDSRNYYTHYNLNTKNKALKGADLFYLYQKMKNNIPLVINKM